MSIEFHLDRNEEVFQTTEDYVFNELLYGAYKEWEKIFEAKPGIRPEGLLERAMEDNDDTLWNYKNSQELRNFLKSVLENAMVNRHSIPDFVREINVNGAAETVLRYADGSPMKDSDISFLLEFYKSGAFDKVEED